MNSVFVISKSGKPLMPCKPSRARKLLKAGAAKPIWSKFGTFGIQLLTETSEHTQDISVGIDVGTKFEGYSIASVQENLLNIKVDLPDKSKIVRKMEERKILRRNRRSRNCRRRKARFNSRSRKGFIAPSQLVIVNCRITIINNLLKIYPITICGLEDVKFNHFKKSWGKNFSTCEIGKAKIRKFFQENNIKLFEFKGFKTKILREKYGYKKISDKSANKFEAHNSDSLSLALEVLGGVSVIPLDPIIVDRTYKFVRRKLHDTQPAPGGKRAEYSKGTVFGIKKGKLVGYKNKQYILTGYQSSGKYTITNIFDKKKRNSAAKLDFVSGDFIRRVQNSSVA